MSILSNHFPDVLDLLNGGPPEPCCRPELTGQFCPACGREYEDWLDEIVDILPEPCGQQFPDDLPF